MKRRNKKIILSPEEQEHVLRERVRINLDHTDWKLQPVVTRQQLFEMSGHVASRIMGSPDIWIADTQADILWNLEHPENSARAEKRKLLNSLSHLQEVR